MTRARRLLLRIAKAFAAITVVAWLAWFVVSLWAEREFETKVAEMREQGWVVDLAALNRPPPPDSENAVVVLREAAKLYKDDRLREPPEAMDIEMWEDSRPDPDDADLERAWRAVAAWQSELGPWFAAVDRAARMPKCDFGFDFTHGIEASAELFPVSPRIAEAYKWAIRLAERRGGPPEDAVRGCETLLLWAQKLDSRMLVLFLTSFVVDGYAAELLQRTARIPGFDIQTSRRTLDPLLVQAERDAGRLRLALRSELATHIDVCRMRTTWEGTRRLGKFMFFQDPPTVGLRLRMMLQRRMLWTSASRAIDLHQKGCEIIEADAPDAYAELQALAKENVGDAWLPGGMRVGLHMRLRGVQKSRLRHRAQIRVARMGLAALAYRQRHGSWPEYPEELAPLFPDGVPVDPFTLEPFEFALDNGVLRIEAAVPWLDEYPEDWREDERVYWKLEVSR